MILNPFKRKSRILFIHLVTCALSFAVQANQGIDRIHKNIQTYESQLTQLQNSLDSTLFDEQELMITLDFDAESLTQFVQEQVVYHPYNGALKGVQATLVSRSGNTLDQSLLLAKMLGDAGFETRIATTQLSEAQARLVLNQIKRAQPDQKIANSEEFQKALESMNSKPIEQIDISSTNTYKRYLKTRKLLDEFFDSKDFELQPQPLNNQLLQVSKEYFWVEYRLGPSEDWQQAHTLKGFDDLGLKSNGYFQDAVPEKHLHKVRIQAFIQQRFNGKLITHSLMPAWEKPSANLFSTPITYTNAPSGISKDKSIEQIANDTQYFTPVFNGQAVGGKVFDMKGRLVDAEAMASPAGALFQTIGDKNLKAVEAIGGLGSKKKEEKSEPLMELVAQYLEFTFVSPNGEEHKEKRYLYHKTKNSNEMMAKLKLMTEVRLLTKTGDYSISHLANRFLELQKQGLPMLKASVEYTMNNNKKVKFPNKMPISEYELLVQYYWMDKNPDLAADVIKYQSSPNMMSVKRGYSSKDSAFLAVDIIRNQQQFLQNKKGEWSHSSTQAFQQGVWETASEWIPAQLTGLDSESMDTLALNPSASEWQFIKTSQTSSEMLAADHSKGYLLISDSKDGTSKGWWRVHPTTGEILGMTADGGGQSYTEYLIEVTQIGLTLVRSIGNLKKCDAKPSPGEKMCCLLEAHINNVTGLAVGSFNGAVGGTLASAVFDIADFGTELATGSGLVPGANLPCDKFDDFNDFNKL